MVLERVNLPGPLLLGVAAAVHMNKKAPFWRAMSTLVIGSSVEASCYKCKTQVNQQPKYRDLQPAIWLFLAWDDIFNGEVANSMRTLSI